jgi:hypothetical protein
MHESFLSFGYLIAPLQLGYSVKGGMLPCQHHVGGRVGGGGQEQKREENVQLPLTLKFINRSVKLNHRNKKIKNLVLFSYETRKKCDSNIFSISSLSYQLKKRTTRTPYFLDQFG